MLLPWLLSVFSQYVFNVSVNLVNLVRVVLNKFYVHSQFDKKFVVSHDVVSVVVVAVYGLIIAPSADLATKIVENL